MVLIMCSNHVFPKENILLQAYQTLLCRELKILSNTAKDLLRSKVLGLAGQDGKGSQVAPYSKPATAKMDGGAWAELVFWNVSNLLTCIICYHEALYCLDSGTGHSH